VREALRDWLRDSREKIRMKAAFLMALIGEPEEVAEALTRLGVPQEGIPEDIAERRLFLRRVLEAREEEL
jgi:alkanesulfonate monooxygenase SsuD/methylene tetrahydromethanopterin reductase-like flavin-dependent oxidoreductase (luciferase family)